jgi:hypothetical protein
MSYFTVYILPRMDVYWSNQSVNHLSHGQAESVLLNFSSSLHGPVLLPHTTSCYASIRVGWLPRIINDRPPLCRARRPSADRGLRMCFAEHKCQLSIRRSIVALSFACLHNHKARKGVVQVGMYCLRSKTSASASFFLLCLGR